MMQSDQFLQPSWSYYNNNNFIESSLNESSFLNDLDMDLHMGDCNFSPSFTNSDYSDDVFSVTNFPTMNIPSMFPPEQCSHVNLEEFGSVEFSDVFEWMERSENSLLSQQQYYFEEELKESENSSTNSCEMSSVLLIQPSLVFPKEDMKVENQLSIPHLLKAYGEAMENEQPELAEVILRRISDKVSPVGTTIDRLAYYLFRAFENQGDHYLNQESIKNYENIFKAFYQIFPYGKFAHFTANSAILETIPEDTETIHIIDFDMGEGVQWPSLIEAIGERILLKITSIKWTDDFNHSTCQWKFEETKKRLEDHAKSFGIKLKVEEMEMEEVVSEIMKTREMSVGREFLAFNCMVGLPHMGRGRTRRHVKEFLWVAKELIRNPSSDSSFGVITFGDGDFVEERIQNCFGFGSFFDGNSVKFHALLESMELQFPTHFTEARIAMECLFVAPYLSFQAWFNKWEESKEGLDFCQLGLEGLRFSRENLVEAKEMVREGESPYEVRVYGENHNLMALEWRGTPLVRISTWR